MTHTRVLLGLTLLTTIVACKGGDKAADKKADEKSEAKAGDEGAEEEPVESLQVEAGDGTDPGPVPPESDMVFFTVENAVYPLACFQADKKAITTGTPCLDMLEAGAEARVGSTSATDVVKLGERVEPLCLAGSGKKVAVAAEGVGGGATFHFGAFPRSTYKTIDLVDEGSFSRENLDLNEAQQLKLLAAVASAGGRGETVVAHQIARLDLDGNDKPDEFFSVFVPHPRTDERYQFSGAFLAMDGNLDELQLVEKSKSKEDVFETRGTFDLDGDGLDELWVRMVFAEGAGDRVVKLTDKGPKSLGPWSCGA